MFLGFFYREFLFQFISFRNFLFRSFHSNNLLVGNSTISGFSKNAAWKFPCHLFQIFWNEFGWMESVVKNSSSGQLYNNIIRTLFLRLILMVNKSSWRKGSFLLVRETSWHLRAIFKDVNRTPSPASKVHDCTTRFATNFVSIVLVI